MRTGNRVILAVGVAFVFTGSLIAGLFFWMSGPGLQDGRTSEVSRFHSQPGAEMLREEERNQSKTTESEAEEESETTEAASPLAQPPDERPIEEWVLGEDPGAVFYLSRIREMHRGNPVFARELLHKMKEDHPDSGLIEAAEMLLERGWK